MALHLREIDRLSHDELLLVTERCMSAVLETIPEFEGSQIKAKEVLPNFDREQMSAMIARDLTDPTKRIMVATDSGRVIGQMLYSRKVDDEGTPYGFCFSAYVLPEHRKQGIAKELMKDALGWFGDQQVEYVLAQTHATNTKVLSLAAQMGFQAQGPHQGNWSYYTLRLDLKRE